MKRINQRNEDVPIPWDFEPEEDAKHFNPREVDDDWTWAERRPTRAHRSSGRRHAGDRRRLRSRWDQDDWDS